MRYVKSLLLILLVSILLTNCNKLQSEDGTELEIDGEVTYMEIEGGFWAIQDEEETYEPLNLPEEFKKEGLPVTVQATIEKDKLSFRMVGPIIEISSISER